MVGTTDILALTFYQTIVKWDLDNDRAMVGAASKKIRRLIRGLEKEGRL